MDFKLGFMWLEFCYCLHYIEIWQPEASHVGPRRFSMLAQFILNGILPLTGSLGNFIINVCRQITEDRNKRSPAKEEYFFTEESSERKRKCLVVVFAMIAVKFS